MYVLILYYAVFLANLIAERNFRHTNIQTPDCLSSVITAPPLDPTSLFLSLTLCLSLCRLWTVCVGGVIQLALPANTVLRIQQQIPRGEGGTSFERQNRIR